MAASSSPEDTAPPPSSIGEISIGSHRAARCDWPKQGRTNRRAIHLSVIRNNRTSRFCVVAHEDNFATQIEDKENFHESGYFTQTVCAIFWQLALAKHPRSGR